MNCKINGTDTTLELDITLGAYLASMGLVAERVVVEHNKTVVARGAFEETRLIEGDQLEILSFVGGG